MLTYYLRIKFAGLTENWRTRMITFSLAGFPLTLKYLWCLEGIKDRGFLIVLCMLQWYDGFSCEDHFLFLVWNWPLSFFAFPTALVTYKYVFSSTHIYNFYFPSCRSPLLSVYADMSVTCKVKGTTQMYWCISSIHAKVVASMVSRVAYTCIFFETEGSMYLYMFVLNRDTCMNLR